MTVRLQVRWFSFSHGCAESVHEHQKNSSSGIFWQLLSHSRDHMLPGGALDVPEGTRRKTRKAHGALLTLPYSAMDFDMLLVCFQALLPGHASRPQEVQHKI